MELEDKWMSRNSFSKALLKVSSINCGDIRSLSLSLVSAARLDEKLLTLSNRVKYINHVYVSSELISLCTRYTTKNKINRSSITVAITNAFVSN
jgi:hypothetical protein